ncbi:uncharacterized protein HD556DRAFT_1476118 [Suillus plorans]|uniref:Uncharacterized protein n=1 Tax=Suillus plorans TaxID=116603 RepID=A0A9P7DIG3_9AGAM|nr:uncharacterized protein HD556DRAFT_1476118 [Suillus plorans]KAG1794221.1 hypothetical protein HD556DRAFT_1476118 [Suillus plorans]
MSSEITSSTTATPTTMHQTLPYNTRQRLTPVGSVLAPMTQDEIQLYKNYHSIGTQRLINKRKRVHSREPDDYQERPAKRHAADVEMVVDHCKRLPAAQPTINAAFPDILRPEVGVKQRKESPIMGLKNFNNWARIREMLAVDIAHMSVEQAQHRWATMRPRRFDASFAALDCYTEPPTKVFTPEQLDSTLYPCSSACIMRLKWRKKLNACSRTSANG